MSIIRFLLLFIFLMPFVSALDVNINNNVLTINGKFASIITIFYEDNKELKDVIDLTRQCKTIICNGKYSYGLSKVKLPLGKSYYFNIYDYKEKKTKRFNFGFKGGVLSLGKGLYEQCSLNSECASGNCVNQYCCPIDKECYFNNKCYDVGNFTPDKQYVCSSLGKFESCQDYCSKQGKSCANGECILVAPKMAQVQALGNINVKNFDYLRNEKESIGKPIGKAGFGVTDFYKNILPAEKHPVVLYNDINVIKDRITREPYKSWWNEIKNRHEWVVNYDITKLNRIQKATYAKIMAFVYAITKEEKYGDKARDLLVNMNYGGYDKKHFEDIDSLVYFSEAYDMLKGAGYNFEKAKLSICSYKHCVRVASNLWMESCKTTYKCEERIRGLLKEQIKQVAETSLSETVFNAGDSLTRKNNHHIRRYSAVGIASIAIHSNEYFGNVMNGGSTFGLVGEIVDFAANILTSIVGWFSSGTADDMRMVRLTYNGLDDPINNQIISISDGGWREGPHYMAYSFTTGIPFMKTMKNAGLVNDWLVVDKLRNTLISWAIAVHMPNGAIPPFDDSNLATSYSPSGYLESDLGNWLWKKGDYKTFWDGAWAKIDAISYYNDRAGEQEPQLYPTQFLGNTGIFFRNNWKSDGIYLGFLGENDRAIDNELLGYTHEHKDTMSFVLYAYGKYLALDSGYIDWDNKKMVSKPVNHNVVLVNGGIAEQGNIIRSDFMPTDYLEYGEIKNNLGHERGILFVDKSYFLVFDSLKSSYNTNYEYLLHGNGLQGSSSFNYLGLGMAEWTQGNVSLLGYVLPNTNDNIQLKSGVHCNTWPNVEKHTYMSVFRIGTNVGFLSLLYPAVNKNYPAINKVMLNGVNILKLNKDNWKGFAFVNENNKLINLNEINLETDASKFFVKLKDNKIDYLFADDVTKLNLDGKELVRSNVPTTISIRFIGNDLEIYYKDNGNIRLNRIPTQLVYNNGVANNLISNNGVNL